MAAKYQVKMLCKQIFKTYILVVVFFVHIIFIITVWEDLI